MSLTYNDYKLQIQYADNDSNRYYVCYYEHSSAYRQRSEIDTSHKDRGIHIPISSGILRSIRQMRQEKIHSSLVSIRLRVCYENNITERLHIQSI